MFLSKMQIIMHKGYFDKIMVIKLEWSKREWFQNKHNQHITILKNLIISLFVLLNSTSIIKKKDKEFSRIMSKSFDFIVIGGGSGMI